jgi:hypothetical protein
MRLILLTIKKKNQIDLFDNRKNDRIRHGTREAEKRRKRTGIQAAFWSKS